MSRESERRRASRIQRQIEAELIAPPAAPTAIGLQNLSVIGLQATVATPPPPGTRCRITLRDEGHTIEARGVVVRAGEGVFAMRFEELPYESFERLQALLLRHAEDPRVIAEELSDRLGFLGESA